MLRRWIEWLAGHMYMTLAEYHEAVLQHDRRVAELLTANNAELAARREISAKLRVLQEEHRLLLDVEVRQRRRAIAAMVVNQRWVEKYRYLRTAAKDEAQMLELVGRWGDCAVDGQALDQIRISDDDDVSPRVLTDYGGLLPGWRPGTWDTLSPAARKTWEEHHADRTWLTHWKPPVAEPSPRSRPLDRGEKPADFKIGRFSTQGARWAE